MMFLHSVSEVKKPFQFYKSTVLKHLPNLYFSLLYDIAMLNYTIRLYLFAVVVVVVHTCLRIICSVIYHLN